MFQLEVIAIPYYGYVGNVGPYPAEIVEAPTGGLFTRSANNR